MRTQSHCRCGHWARLWPIRPAAATGKTREPFPRPHLSVVWRVAASVRIRHSIRWSCSPCSIIPSARTRASSVCAGRARRALRLVEERPWARRQEFLLINPAGTTPVLVDRRRAGFPAHRRSASSSTRRSAARWTTSSAAQDTRPHRGAAAAVMVQREVLRGGFQAAGDRAHLQALHGVGRRRRPAGHRFDPCRAKANIRYHLHYIGWLVGTETSSPASD